MNIDREPLPSLDLAWDVRNAMPSLDFILQGAVSSDWSDQDWLRWPEYRSIRSRAEMINVAFRTWGRQYLYDVEELQRRRAEAGVPVVLDATHGASEHAKLRGLERRADSLLICEARKV